MMSSWPLGDPIVYDGVLSGEDQPGVSPEEAVFFKENGFLVKVGLYRTHATHSVYTLDLLHKSPTRGEAQPY